MDIAFWREVAGLVANLVLLTTAIAAARGVAHWANEYKGGKRIDLAEDLLATAYEVREAISFMRGPFAWDSESTDLVRLEGESEHDYRVRKTYSVAYFRYKEHVELFSRLRSICFRVEALFGRPHGKPVRMLLQAPHIVIAAGSTLGRMAARGEFSLEAQRVGHDELRQRLERDLWEGLGNDTLAEKLENALAAIEGFARQVIESNGDAVEFSPPSTLD